MKKRKRYKINKVRFTASLLIMITLIITPVFLTILVKEYKMDRAAAEAEEQALMEAEEARLEGTAPEIELRGDNTVRIPAGETFSEPGFRATDVYGNDITDSVEVRIPSLVTDDGDHIVLYSVKDRNGNRAMARRRILLEHPVQTEEGRNRGLSVLMYHMVYDPLDPPDWPIDTNMITTNALEEELQYLTENGYYFPSWEEVRSYLDGEIDLPEKSVCLTFDDGKKIFEEYGVPLIQKYDVRATAFIIGTYRGDHWASKAKEYDHLWLGSHSYDMHRSGGYIGHGGIFTALGYDDALADLKKSAEQIGSTGAFAYPFGDYTDQCAMEVRDAGFLCAFTTEYGRIYPGNDPMKLRRMRVSGSPTLEQFKGLL